jgi:cytochrome P450 family 6
MTFMSYELALNQDIQDKLRDEINEVLPRHKLETSYDAVMEMKYLDMIFNESMRRYPIVDRQMRKCVKDFPIPNTKLVIPAGTGILIPIPVLHHDERYWENPNKFDPERFNEENVKKQVPYSFLPFSEGPRQCIGLRWRTFDFYQLLK